MSKPTQYVVKANGPAGVSWLSAANDAGQRSLVSREQADLFPDVKYARTAIARLPQGFKDAGVLFLVQLVPLPPAHL